MKHYKYIFIILAFLVSCNTRSDEEVFRSKLLKIIDNEEWLSGKNDRAIEKVLDLIDNSPESLNYQMQEIDSERYIYEPLIRICTSEDGNVRVYNIVPEENPSFNPDGKWIIQYRIDDTVYTSLLSNKHSSVNNIFVIESLEKRYYLFVDYSSYISQREHFDETITAYTLNPETCELQEEELFNSGKELLSKIGLEWEYSRLINGKEFYSELHHIYCEDDELRIPLVTKNKIMIEGYLLYLWNGEFFIYKGIEPIAEFKANEFTVRIEILSDGSYKYTSWGKNRSTEQKPDIILYDGIMECWDETGECDCNAVYDDGIPSLLGRKYTFKNNEYSYCFDSGWWEGSFCQYFTIYKGAKELSSTEAKIIRINNMNY